MLRLDTTRICGPLVCLLAFAILYCQARPNYVGLTGAYCAAHFNELNCCPGRMDNCSVPILGTLCYCDDFCNNRTDDDADCCPDFFSYCRGEDGPGPLIKGWCYDNGQKYEDGKFVKKNNCNECSCVAPEGEGEVLCETNVCLMDQEIINEINYLESPGWIARNYSKFWGRTLNDGLKLRLGTINPSQSVRQMLPVTRHYNPNDLPREFDSRIQWGNDITPVQDQGWCGASWAVSTVDVASDRFAIMSKGIEKVQLSGQHLISCNNKGQRACKGGYLDRAWFFMRKFGVVDEDCYPWLGGKTDKCRIPRRGKLSDAGCQRRNSYSMRNEMYKVGPAYRLGNETDVMQEILTSGPVQATMRVHHDFFHYESGIYVHSSPFKTHQTGYHSVRIVGWGEEPSPYNGKPIKFWRVANSWGRDWGEDGYFRIIRGRNECEIESFVLGVWANTARNAV